jgi:hypothetical protein
MKLPLLLLLISLYLTSCTEKDGKGKDIEYRLFEFDVENIIVSTEIVNCDWKEFDDVVTARYCGQTGCVEYRMQDKKGNYISTKLDTLNLLFTQDLKYIINGAEYEVLKFVADSHAIDSETEHYWSPKFGIILIKSRTWGNFKIMTGNRKYQDSDLNALTTILLQEKVHMNQEQSHELLDSATNKMVDDELKE